ncbi:MAG: PDZ domain-containing protein, partial [Candidatus Hydrogenedentes bacterium]|nr:PDZ domain-containing protein [Candidatus Hydrogenedentota bacterium]
MAKRDSKRDFFVTLGFLVCLILLLSNGFLERIEATESDVDVYREIEPIGSVLDIILREYVQPVEMEAVVEGALSGIMSSLDRNSAFVTAAQFQALQEDTRGEFDGIGVSIKQNDEGRIIVFMPLPGSPASAAGIKPFDIIAAVDGTTTEGLDTAQTAQLIRGKRNTTVMLSILRNPGEDAAEDAEPETFDVEVKRARIPLESVKETQMLQDKVGYIRISSFSDTTAEDTEKSIKELLDQGMKALVLDVRWNPGGLLSASKEVCELFLPKGLLVTYTRGRARADGSP